MKNKIGILTYHAAHNYGSMLQAFALQSFLEQRGFNVRILNLRKSIQKKVYAQTLDIKHPKSFIYRLLKNPVDSVNCQKKWSKFERFIRENLNVTKECKDVQEVRTLISKDSYYAFVVGSDQIWNTACLDFDNSFLLPFEGNFKKVAYAPSMGPKPVFQNKDFEELFAKYLPMFDGISTRETQSSKFLHEKFSIDTTTVLDPVLLLTDDTYSSLYGEKPLIKGKYIFYYSPLCKKEYYEKAQQLSLLTGLPIVVTQSHDYYGGAKTFYACGPKEFLNILKYSTYTIGRSFHLLAFSLLFHKDFYSIDGAVDDRMFHLMNHCNLLNRSVLVADKIGKLQPAIDYENVDVKLEELRKRSILYLSENL